MRRVRRAGGMVSEGFDFYPDVGVPDMLLCNNMFILKRDHVTMYEYVHTVLNLHHYDNFQYKRDNVTIETFGFSLEKPVETVPESPDLII